MAISPAFRDILEMTLCCLGNAGFISCCEPSDLQRKFWSFLTSSDGSWHTNPCQWPCTSYAEINRMFKVLLQNQTARSTGRVTYNLSPKWHSTGYHGWLCKLSAFSHVCDPWRDNLNAHYLPLHIQSLVWGTSKFYVLPMAMSLKAILSISHVSDAVFLSFKPKLMQLWCSFVSPIGKSSIILNINDKKHLYRSNTEVYGSKLTRLTQKTFILWHLVKESNTTCCFCS
jgi:hypothetical protein